MKEYYQKVDKRSKKAMISYLESHLKYSTMNSWNRTQSYANNIKIYNLGLPKDLEDKFYIATSDNVEFLEFTWLIDDMKEEFAKEWGYYPGFNGRSGGYLVLYQTCLVDGKREIYPGKPFPSQLDEYEEDMDIDLLRQEVEVVQAFDKWTDNLLNRLSELVDGYEFIKEEREIIYEATVAVPSA